MALVHDHLVIRGGAERVLLSLSKLFPGAPIYTAIYRPKTTFAEFVDLDVRPLWPDRIPVSEGTYRPLAPAFAMAFEQLDLGDFDLALSHTTGFAKSAGARAGTRVYCATPHRVTSGRWEQARSRWGR